MTSQHDTPQDVPWDPRWGHSVVTQAMPRNDEGLVDLAGKNTMENHPCNWKKTW